VVRFSIEPRNWIGVTGDILPASSEETQFISSMVFTNEQALNLRAVPLVYQDGEDYGRQIVLQVPKGHFYLGPEQADALIDQDPEVSEQIGWWNRQGAEVIRVDPPSGLPDLTSLAAAREHGRDIRLASAGD
jgi:uncharacterized protein